MMSGWGDSLARTGPNRTIGRFNGRLFRIPSRRDSSRLRVGGLARCRDNTNTTAEGPTFSPTTSHSAWSGSRWSPGLSWAEVARRLGTYPLTIRRWRYKGVRPNLAHQTALLDLADDLGLGYIFTE